MTDDVEKTEVEKTIEKLRKQFGERIIITLKDKPMDVPVISTGSLTLDRALGVGGIPRGRITEIYGPEGAGKTTLLHHIVAEAQKAGDLASFIDMEHDVDLKYMAACGVDIDAVLFSQPDNGAQALDVAEALIRDNAVGVIAVDSVASLVPPAEMQMSAEDQSVGLQPRMMSQWLRKIKPLLGLSDVALVFSNQLRMKIGVMFGNPETQPGGRALKFHASIRLDIRRIALLGKEDDHHGIRSRVRVKKNKVAPPFTTAEFDIEWGVGIDKEADVLNMAVATGVMEAGGGHYKWQDKEIGHGKEKAKAYLREHPKLVEEIREAVLASDSAAETEPEEE